MQWTTKLIKRFNQDNNQALCVDKPIINEINQDFGHLTQGKAKALFKPTHLKSLQRFLKFCYQHQLSITLRTLGLSQSGQSLAKKDSVTVDLSELNLKVSEQKNKIIAGASVRFSKVIEKSLERQRLPLVFPHNNQLSIGGLLSVGGIGASSFKKGIATAYVSQLKVITAKGDLLTCNHKQNSDLFEACLAGTGLFGIIYEAVLKTKAAKPYVYTATLEYQQFKWWIEDQFRLRDSCDYLEAYWFITKDSCYKINIAIQSNAPNFKVRRFFLKKLNASNLIETGVVSIKDYVYRHEDRLQCLRLAPLVDSKHPWYECYLSKKNLLKLFDKLKKIINPSIGEMIAIFPIAPIKSRFFMLPLTEEIITFNILMPILKNPQGLEIIEKLNELFISAGGKRYISGWFNHHNVSYWSNHYENLFEIRNQIKHNYDPHNLFGSQFYDKALAK